MPVLTDIYFEINIVSWLRANYIYFTAEYNMLVSNGLYIIARSHYPVAGADTTYSIVAVPKLLGAGPELVLYTETVPYNTDPAAYSATLRIHYLGAKVFEIFVNGASKGTVTAGGVNTTLNTIMASVVVSSQYFYITSGIPRTPPFYTKHANMRGW